MSWKRNCYDNVPTESYWGCLKQGFAHHCLYKTRAEAKAAIQEYVLVYCNRMCRHSSIGNIAPSIYAESFFGRKKSA